MKGAWTLWVEASTQPYYMCVFYFLGALLTKALFDVNVVDDWPSWCAKRDETLLARTHQPAAAAAQVPAPRRGRLLARRHARRLRLRQSLRRGVGARLRTGRWRTGRGGGRRERRSGRQPDAAEPAALNQARWGFAG